MKMRPLNLGIIIVVGFCCGCHSNDHLFPVKVDGKVGYINQHGQIVVTPRFNEGYTFTDGMAIVGLAGKYGYLDLTGTVVLPLQYAEAHGFGNNHAQVLTVSGEKVFIDRKGRQIFKKISRTGIETSADFNDDDGLAMARVGEKWGFIDRNLKMKIPAVYDNVWPFGHGTAAVRFKRKWGIINTVGAYIVEPRYEEVLPLIDDDILQVKLNEKWGLINIHTMQFVMPPRYLDMGWMSEGLIPFSTMKADDLFHHGSWGFIDIKGNIIIKEQFRASEHFQSGLAAVKIGEKWGYINRSGTMVIKPRFGEVSGFRGNIATVHFRNENGSPRQGFINRSGKFIFPPDFYQVSNFDHGLARVWPPNHSDYGYINKTGKWIWKPTK